MLDAYGDLFCRALRTLHALRRSGKAPTKPAFMVRFGLTARQYNAVRVTLDGMERSYRERLAGLIDEDRERCKSIRARIKNTEDALRMHDLKRRVARVEARIAYREQDRANGTVRIAFGSRRLQNAQHHLGENGFANHEAWKSQWKLARSGQFFVLGSKDETAGCQGCVLQHRGEGVFTVRLRLPNASALRYLSFEVRFAYGWEQIAWALQAGGAISYRFVRDAKGWRMFASTVAAPISLQSELGRGALGADLNADHVALSLSSADGNLVAFERVALVTYGRTAQQAAAATGDAVKRIVTMALHARVPIVVESLDFTRKKARLREQGARYARMLSSFAYRRFMQVLCARAHDAGIAVRLVNPAYSSVIGRHKFMRRYGISSHIAAALVIARRAQGFSERYSRHGQVAFVVPVRKRQKHVWSSWAAIARSEKRRLYLTGGRCTRGDPTTASGCGDATPAIAATYLPSRWESGTRIAANTVRAAS